MKVSKKKNTKQTLELAHVFCQFDDSLIVDKDEDIK